ncbi:hypothetical protein TB1_015948 [Malus domestica]
MELSPQELRPRFPHLPSVWKPSWIDPEVCADVLQAVLPQQCQGDWLHQGRPKLRHDIRTCEYEDVHVMWRMLNPNDRSETIQLGGVTPKRKRFSNLFDWIKRAPSQLQVTRIRVLGSHRILAAGEATQKTLARFKDGTLERMELSPQELRPRFPHLPSVWKPSWVDPEVCADVLQAVLPQQCQGDWLHQGMNSIYLVFFVLFFCLCFDCIWLLPLRQC